MMIAQLLSGAATASMVPPSLIPEKGSIAAHLLPQRKPAEEAAKGRKRIEAGSRKIRRLNKKRLAEIDRQREVLYTRYGFSIE